jgi:transposase
MHRLILTPAQHQKLVALRNSASKAYLRERAAALLKIAAGQPAAAVARSGLLRPRQPDTVYRWLRRYRAEGIAGLSDRPGRGRKPAVSPAHPDAATAQAVVLDVLRRALRLLGVVRTRWMLASVCRAIP